MAARKRRIAVVTGSRAEYGLLKSTIHAISTHPQLELQLIATGMHLLRRFGSTVREIERDDVPIAARVRMQHGDDSPIDQARGLARGISGIAAALEARRSDVVLVLGDRIEAMAGALAALTTGRWLAHVHGGDIAEGDIDESLRHGISKLAHIHFPATTSAAQRIAQMGERPARIHRVGATGLDRIRELESAGEFAASPCNEALVIQHAYGRSAAREERVARIVLEAAAECGLRRRIIYPNSDRGCSGVIRAIESHARQSHSCDVIVNRSLPRDAFIKAMSSAAFVIGNSSCGIIEAPFIGVPSINVGDRQRGRQPGGASVIDTRESKSAIRRAIAQALTLRQAGVGSRQSAIYGDGTAGRQIAAILARANLDESQRRKQFVSWEEPRGRKGQDANHATYRRFRMRNRSRRLS